MWGVQKTLVAITTNKPGGRAFRRIRRSWTSLVFPWSCDRWYPACCRYMCPKHEDWSGFRRQFGSIRFALMRYSSAEKTCNTVSNTNGKQHEGIVIHGAHNELLKQHMMCKRISTTRTNSRCNSRAPPNGLRHGSE